VSPETESVSSTRRIGRPSVSMHISSIGLSSKELQEEMEGVGGSHAGRTHARQPSPVLKKTARQMMSYPLVYMLIWTIPTTIRIYQSVTGKPAPFGIGTVDKVSLQCPLHSSGVPADCPIGLHRHPRLRRRHHLRRQRNIPSSVARTLPQRSPHGTRHRPDSHQSPARHQGGAIDAAPSSRQSPRELVEVYVSMKWAARLRNVPGLYGPVVVL
jgi:hypothetical protein